jgi:hypothetical protein
MITIINISDTKFSFNGINYFKNFTPFVTGNKVSIVNTYDACISLTNFPTIYSDISVDGVTYGSVAALQNALLPVLFNRTFSQSGSLTVGYIPKATGSNTLGNSLIYDNGTNIGIGTTSPVSLLNIASTFPQFTLTRTDNGTNAAAAINFSAQSTVKWQISTNNAVGTGFEINQGDASNNRFYINTSGNVGIGYNSPTAKLNVAGNIHIGDYGSASSRVLDFRTNNSLFTITTDGTSGGLGTTISYSWANGGQGPLKFNNASSEVMRLTSGGALCVGTTTSSYISSGRGVISVGGTSQGIYSFEIGGVGKGYIYHEGTNIYLNNNVTSGNIYVTANTNGVYLAANGIAWIANSDERLKTDLVPINDALNKVCSLRSVIGRYKTDDESIKRPFLIAQDVLKVLPEAVVEDEKTGNLGVSYSEIIPLLVASIKELKAEIEILKN